MRSTHTLLGPSAATVPTRPPELPSAKTLATVHERPPSTVRKISVPPWVLTLAASQPSSAFEKLTEYALAGESTRVHDSPPLSVRYSRLVPL